MRLKQIVFVCFLLCKSLNNADYCFRNNSLLFCAHNHSGRGRIPHSKRSEID